jgi:hypothetical protein
VAFTIGSSALSNPCAFVDKGGVIRVFGLNVNQGRLCQFLTSQLAVVCVAATEDHNDQPDQRDEVQTTKDKAQIHWPPLLRTTRISWNKDLYIACPSGHYTHTFMAVDGASDCCAPGHMNHIACVFPSTSLPPAFQCRTRGESVPFSLVCDSKADCSDDSDENFCVFQSCRSDQNDCGNGQVSPDNDLTHSSVTVLDTK